MFNNNLCSSSLHGRDLINAVVARWLDGKCQWLLATALKVQHCWTLKTTVGDCWRQWPTCAGDSRQLKYKHARDCRRLSPSRATVGDWSINQALSLDASKIALSIDDGLHWTMLWCNLYPFGYLFHVVCSSIYQNDVWLQCNHYQVVM